MKTFISMAMLVLLMASPGFKQAQTDAKPLSGEETSDKVTQIIDDMNDKEKIGQLVMLAPQDGDDGMPDEFTKEMIQEYGMGSVIVRGERDAATQAEYNNQLQAYAADNRMNVPLFTTADLENGAAQQVPEDATTFPRQMGVGATNSLQHAETFARIAGQEADALGFNWSYSPVADVNVDPLNPVIGVRAFSEQTDLVSEMTAAQVSGYQEEDVIATAKHFPGHGDTDTDSHFELPTVTYDREELEELHLPPFQSAIDADIDSMMTAHIIIEAIDSELPATLSEDVLTGLLREDMGFDGLIVTDDMAMEAITDNWGAGEAAVMSIQAGADIVMALASPTEAHDALYDAYQSGELSEERVHESLERVLTKKLEYDLFDDRYVDASEAEAFVGNQEHQDIAEQMGRDSITLAKNEDILPFDEDSEETTFVAGVTHVNDIAERVQQQSNGEVLSWQAGTDDPTSEEIEEAVNQAADADRILVPTFSIDELPDGQSQLVEALKETDNPVAAISLGLPYDVQNYPDVDAYLASYALDNWELANSTSINAAVDVVFGEQPGGELPVTIEDHYEFGHGLSYEPSNASDIEQLVEQYERKGAFEKEEAVRHLLTHLTAVHHYENEEEADKVVTHVEGFKDLLNDQEDNALISKEAYEDLQDQANDLLEQWQ
ncbi:glycoside hydrolase family 3 protein [Salicibibacter halophilus]|uniref:beta-N-acetylhexosaminidase n=1 Tax=Salicibibacter halophilus TaxID=2502791 RepID=A0A514LK27_9BACI|nr:glycoside hydrolase family 3 protein [Salicibibacter halophilus]QDI92199.1 glycoside hydrolase family 3 protein [Salicibibacter halophilus]